MKTEEEVLSLNDPYLSYFYCINNLDTANIKAHERIIIDSKHPYYCYWFALDIEHSNKQLLFEIILASGNLYFINFFYENVDFDKTKYENLMMFV
jgi:hypothetical protein